MAPKAKKGTRRATPYNTYVARDRQQKYYERKKALSRFGRLQRFEERQEKGADSSSRALLEKVLAKSAEEVEAEYERKLELSYGGAAEIPVTAKKKNRRSAKRGTEYAEGAMHGAGPQKAKRINAEGAGSSKQPTSEIGDAVRSRKRKRTQPEGTAATAGPRGKTKSARSNAPTRFQRELRQYEAAQDLKAAERQKQEEEQRQRNRKRRENARDRAVTGQLLARRNARGQPSMQSMLEMVTSKLEGLPSSKGRGKARRDR